MAVPTVVGVGTFVGTGTGASVSPSIPTGTTDDDIMVVLCESDGTIAPDTGWAHVTGSPVIGADTRLNVHWRRFVTGVVAPVLTRSPNDHLDARMISVRGCKTSGNPWNGTPGVGTEAAGNNTAEFPGQTTTVNDCLVLECIATGLDATSSANVGALTNANYTNIAEQMDDWAAAGTGGGIGCVSATMASAGATGSSTATLGSTDAKALMTLALEPPAAAPPSDSAATNRMLLGVG